ncbi:MAG: cell division protein FtsZ [Verrucomicrobiota bacterium JB022]|nr:cell division protein FtsZ [Verrucomicrobiota bacterium JB022]
MNNFTSDSPLQSAELDSHGIRVKIVGVGGAGNNAVDRLKIDQLDQVDLAVVNTDTKTLSVSPIGEKLMIGRALTRGMSAGGEAEIGRQAAEADRRLIEQMVNGVDLVFLLAGLGGGTGSGAAPVVAETAAASGAIVIAFVTMPFTREGSRRQQQADEALIRLREHCHAVISLPNDLLLQQIDEQATVMEAFALADEWISKGVRSIWSMLFLQGLINVDFATLRSAFTCRGGKTLFGTAEGAGEDAVAQVIRNLDLCPLLHLPENRYLRKADRLIVNITGGTSLTMTQVHEILQYVTDRFGSKEHTVLGAVIDSELGDQLSLTVIGTTDVGSPAKSNRRFIPVPAANAAAQAPQVRVKGEKTPPPVQEPEPDLFNLVVPPELDENEVEPFSPHDPGKQSEFDFPRLEDNRGLFERTEANLYEGEDLDIPTYLRRGIKIAVESRKA